MTDGVTRRIELMNRLKQENRPLSGTELAKAFGVKRGDHCRTSHTVACDQRNILSTNKGYVLYDRAPVRICAGEFFAVNHTDAQMQEELYLMVDCGGYVCDVIVEHEIYGQLSADLILKNRRDVDEFIGKWVRQRICH